MQLHDARNRTYGARQILRAQDMNDIQDGIVDWWRTAHGRFFWFQDDFMGNNVDGNLWIIDNTVTTTSDYAADGFGAAVFAPAAGNFSRLETVPLPMGTIDFRLAAMVRIAPSIGSAASSITIGLRSTTAADEFYYRANGAAPTWNLVSGVATTGIADVYPTTGYNLIEIRRESAQLTFYIDAALVGTAPNVAFTSSPTLRIEHSRDAADAVASVLYVDCVKLWIKR